MKNILKRIRRILRKLEAVHVYMLANPFIAALVFIFIVWIVTGTVVYEIEKDVKDSNIKSYEDGIWWGIVTLLTVGYGDRFPVSFMGRLVAGVLMVSGVVAIAIVTAKISSFFLERALRERRGFVDAHTLKNHFVICGWKDDMPTFILHILASNPKLKPSDIVLINMQTDNEISALLETPGLKDVKVVHGEYFVESNLRRVAPEKAQKILILADATPGPNGEIPTITEADARTIMTAMTLSSIAKGISVAAEIIDSSMDQYLRIAGVNEIIYSRETSRMLLAMSSIGTGITNVFHDLLSAKSPYFVTTMSIPENLLNQPFMKLREFFFENHPKDTLIGILENSGNSHVAKEAALKRAQQTPNIGVLVKNLQEVKALRFNQPIFTPAPDYQVKEGSMAIVIETRVQS